ncbi:2-hydroxyacyl-CoA dehydratase family protein [Candidatus Latescibacterota bacterium]
MRRIGMTTTVPAELIWAAGAVPVDLNNLFITSPRRHDFIRYAEREGYPRNVCNWIKGIYGVLCDTSDIRTVIAVTQGDCSNTQALMETLALKSIEIIPFAYPYERSRDRLAHEIDTLARRLGTTVKAATREFGRLDPVRASLDRLDELTWRENVVSGGENHSWLVASSDFNGNVEGYARRLGLFLDEAVSRRPFTQPVRLAYIGVPPIFDDLYDVIEERGGRVVFNEVQRQFSQPDRTGGLVERYLVYTYPYDVFHRLAFITAEIERRNIHGIIHYVQSFCHRHIQDLVIRKKVHLPVLTIEGEVPGAVDERTKIRLEAFIEMLTGGFG